MNAHLADPLNSRPAIASFVLLGTIGVLSFIVQPALVQGFVTVLALSEQAAVSLAGIEMAGVALATIVLALLGERVNWRHLTLASIAIAVMGDVGSAWLLNDPSLSIARFIAGVGHGGLISLSFTFVGLTRRVERNLALYLVLLLSYGAVGIFLAPSLFADIGLGPIFLAFALITAVSVVALPWLPVSSAARVQVSPHARQLSLAWRVCALGGVLAYNIAQGIAWAILFSSALLPDTRSNPWRMRCLLRRLRPWLVRWPRSTWPNAGNAGRRSHWASWAVQPAFCCCWVPCRC